MESGVRFKNIGAWRLAFYNVRKSISSRITFIFLKNYGVFEGNVLGSHDFFDILLGRPFLTATVCGDVRKFTEKAAWICGMNGGTFRNRMFGNAAMTAPRVTMTELLNVTVTKTTITLNRRANAGFDVENHIID